MRIFLNFLIFITTLFLINVLLYFVSSDYKFFLLKLKYPSDTVYLNEGDYIKNETENSNDDNILEIKNNSYKKQEEDQNIDVVKKIVLGNNYKNILNEFKNIYNLRKIEVNSLLFEITPEYPDYYYEYYSKDLVLYFFPTRSYEEIYNIFDYLKGDLDININEVNNFGDRSFYINLGENIKDNYVRLVIFKDSITFGLKIKKDQYNKVKQILNELN